MRISARKHNSWRSWRATARRLAHERLVLIGLLSLHVIIGIYYSMAIPIWEAHDEVGHYYFVRYLATEHHLPPPGLRLVEQNDELHQPPLYYMLAALPLSLVDAGQEIAIRYNPHMYRAQAQGGFNRVVHDPAAEGWPYRGPVLGVHVARLTSVLLGALGLLFTFLAARQLFPAEPWVRWVAVLVLAFWPQYRFTTAVVNNDIMVTACVAAATWLLLRVVTSAQPRARDVLALGVATGLAPLSKGNGLALVPAVLVVMVGCLLRSRRRKAGRLLGWLAVSLAAGALVVGWWYARNVSGGVAVFGGGRSLAWLTRFFAPMLGRQPAHWESTPPALRQGLQSLWAGFGWNNVGLPMPLYWAALAWVTLGLAGLGLWLWRRPPRHQVTGVVAAILVAATMMVGPLLLKLSTSSTGVQGRYLLAGLPPLTIALARGWTALLPARWLAGWATMGSTLALLALAIPVAWIRPAYAHPRPLQEARLGGYTPLQATFGGFAELVGFRLEEQFVDLGEPVRLSLAWRTLQPAGADYTVAVQLFTGERELLGDIHRFPGRGSLGTSTWEPGYLFAEEVAIPVSADRPDGPLAWLEVSFYDHRNMGAVPVQDGQGKPLGSSARLAWVRLKGAARPRSATVANAFRFGDAINLTGCRAEAQAVSGVPWMDVELQWTTAERPGEDYTVSLQLRDDRGAIVAQADSQPRQGKLPTSYWLPGEVIADRHTLFLPAGLAAGEYRLYVCLYRSETVERLPVLGPHGEVPAAREVKLQRVTVAGPGVAPGLEPETALTGAAGILAWVDEIAAQGKAAVEAALVDGLKAADRAFAGGRRDEGLPLLQGRVLALDGCNLAGLHRQAQEEEASGADPARVASIRERLRHFELESVSVPADPRLALYLGDAMAALADEGTWTHETLLGVASYQVWRFSEGRGAPGLERLLQALLHHYPADADLLFLEAERCHRGGDLDEAQAAYERVLAADPGCAPAVLRLGAVAEAQGKPAEARERYEEYCSMVPGDLLGLKRLSEVSASMGMPGAAALAEQLAARTDDRRLAAELLGVPVEAVALGPNLVQNGDFEEWAGERPRCWEWSPMFGEEPFGAAMFIGAADGLSAFGGKRAARVDGLWTLLEPSKSPPRAGFWYTRGSPESPATITMAVGTPYLFSMDYRTAQAPEIGPSVWLSVDAGVLWRGDTPLRQTDGEWRHLVAIAWNRSELAAAVHPLIRSWAAGTVVSDNVQFRAIRLLDGAAAEAGEPRILLSGAEGRE